jgi:hypothetical protein
MKAKILIFSILINISCYNKPDIIQNKSIENFENQKKINYDIIGEWQMCKTIDKGTETAYNVCPTVTFLINKTGFVITNNKEKHPFTYLQNQKIINFEFTSSDDSKSIFSNITNFEYKIDEKKNLTVLKLINGEFQLVLIRVKN